MHSRSTPVPYLVASLLFASVLGAQTASSGTGSSETGSPTQKKKKKKESPVLVTASRLGSSLFDSPRSGLVYDRENLQELRVIRSLPEALRETAGVSVQKTGPAQGSPKIRGMTGFHTLLLVDGIRVNSSIWRSGNVEYWNTVDPLALERFELVRGPGSVLYGSDAVTGVGQAIAAGPGLPSSWSNSLDYRAHGFVRYASAEDSFIERIESSGNAGKDFGWHAGVSYKSFGEITAGGNTGRLSYTGYQEPDADVKFVLPMGGKARLTMAYQHVEQKKGPRTHSTVFAKSWRGSTSGSDFARDISQKRDLAYIRYNCDDSSLPQEYTLSYQRFAEEENRVRSNSRRRVQGATVHQLGAAARFVTDLGDGRLAFGVEAYHEEVDSYFREYNPGGSLRSVRNRGSVADNAYYQQAGIYGEFRIDVAEDLEWTLGARYSYYEADADQVAVSGSTVPAGPLHKAWNSLVGSTQLLYKASESCRAWASIGQSFRAPNLADLTRFDVALSGDLEVPTTDLDPEQFVTIEIGTRYDDGQNRVGVSIYYTDAKDLIVRFPTGNIVGGNTEVTKANASDGYYLGFEAEAAANLECLGLEEWEVYGFADYVKAEIDAFDPNDPSKVHPKGLPPATGQLGFRWRDALEKYRFELFLPMARRRNSYNAAERRNTQRMPPQGLPGYMLVGLRGSMVIGEHVRASLSIENLTNRDYRIFDSGLNETGTNVILGLHIDL